MSEGVLFEQLKSSICLRDMSKFHATLDEQTIAIGLLKPRLINEILLQCIKISSIEPSTSPPPAPSTSYNKLIDGTEFIESFMFKLHTLKCYFVFSDDTCKSVVKLFVAQNRQFSPYSVNFLLRCHDLELIRQVFDLNLVSDKCSGDCSNWHLMFVASYQERFFTHYFDTIFEGFLARFILLCKLRCSLSQKRFFLTWFAGSLHLYTDEYFLQNEECRFKYVLVHLFESLILNGLLTNSDFVNLSNMLAKRNQELAQINSFKNYSSNSHHQQNHLKKVNEAATSLNLEEASTASSSKSADSSGKNSYFPILDGIFPLSLKNSCRLAVKRSMIKYTKNEIDKLPLPTNLKRFVFFDHECESIYKCFEQIKK